MNRRLGLLLLALGFALALPAPIASAKVTILDSDSGQQVDIITKGKCRVDGKQGRKAFFLNARSDSGKFRLTAFIDPPVFAGFNDSYSAYYGGSDPQIFLHRNSDNELFSNSFNIPGTPAGTVGAGAIAFRNQGTRVGIGLYAASNKSFTEGYSFAGSINCRYRNR